MFNSLTVTGATGAILFGSRVAVDLKAWRIVRSKADGGQWLLAATLGAKVNRVEARRAPLLFAAPRAGGYWAWPVQALNIGETNLWAHLGPPER